MRDKPPLRPVDVVVLKSRRGRPAPEVKRVVMVERRPLPKPPSGRPPD